MAVAPTGNIYKALFFDGVSSRDYGVYITGEAVYNAPERDVEMVTIPGRNGAFALDNGRFENIEVKYPAGIFADNELDFAQAVSDFRNLLCSKKGYCRLTDQYNPDEYRMAVYKSGLEVNPVQLRAGEFEIIFDCKPQRFLANGEAKVTIDNTGDTITNPTLFESSPLLEVEGYGTIGFNGYEIEIDSAELGEMQIANSSSFKSTSTKTITLDTSLLDSADTIYVNDSALISEVLGITDHNRFDTYSVTSSTNVISAYISAPNTKKLEFYLVPDLSTGFAYGTSSTITSSAVYTYKILGGSNTTETVSASFAYDGDDTITITVTRTGTLPTGVSRSPKYDGKMPAVFGYSTSSLLGNPTYIDCDLGECYRIDGGELTSLNQHIDLGSDLPTLGPGANAISFDNTITDLKILPRWWKV